MQRREKCPRKEHVKVVADLELVATGEYTFVYITKFMNSITQGFELRSILCEHVHEDPFRRIFTLVSPSTFTSAVGPPVLDVSRVP